MKSSGTSRRFKVTGLGELLWDLLPNGPRLGGAPANFAYHVHQLGAATTLVSCVGKDKLGEELLSQLESIGLDIRHIITCSKYPTGTVSVLLNSQGKPTYQIHENVAWDNISWKNAMKSVAIKTDAVCFGTLAQRSALSRKTIQRFLTSTRKECLRVYDINLRQTYYTREIIETSLRLANILKLNDEELSIICELLSINGKENERLSILLKKYELQYIALTKGARGSVLMTPERIYVHKGVRLKKIVDTVGAGDSFTAALVMGILRHNSLEDISEAANALASSVCRHSGAMGDDAVMSQFL